MPDTKEIYGKDGVCHITTESLWLTPSKSGPREGTLYCALGHRALSLNETISSCSRNRSVLISGGL